MSIHDEIQTSNDRRKQELENSKKEHLKFLEEQRLSSEAAMQNSVKGNWDRLGEKRKTKVLQRLPLPQLQHNQ